MRCDIVGLGKNAKKVFEITLFGARIYFEKLFGFPGTLQYALFVTCETGSQGVSLNLVRYPCSTWSRDKRLASFAGCRISFGSHVPKDVNAPTRSL